MHCNQSWQSADSEVVPRQESENGGPPRSSGAGYAAAPYTPSQQDGLSDCILLAACGANELLPQSPHVPADVFTACLTTPIKAGARQRQSPMQLQVHDCIAPVSMLCQHACMSSKPCIEPLAVFDHCLLCF